MTHKLTQNSGITRTSSLLQDDPSPFTVIDTFPLRGPLPLDHDAHFPSFPVITEGSVSDVKVGPQFHLNPGIIVVDDRAYNNYVLFDR
jgi:hypothetical protein